MASAYRPALAERVDWGRSPEKEILKSSSADGLKVTVHGMHTFDGNRRIQNFVSTSHMKLELQRFSLADHDSGLWDADLRWTR